MKQKKSIDFNNLKVGIIGLGPIGQTLAVHFNNAGIETAITDLDIKKLDIIRKSGIEIVGKIETKSKFSYVYNSIEELLNHDFDILVCAVKAYHVDSIISEIAKISKKNFFLLSAQNGLDVRSKYIKYFNDSQSFRMVINFAGFLLAPNKVEMTFFNGSNYVASLDDSREDIANWIADNLTKVDLTTTKVDSFTVSSKVWEKTILNAALSPICALSGLTMKEAMTNPDTLEIVEQLIYEAVEVAKAEEIKLPENFAKTCIRYLSNAGNHMPSLAIDLMNKSRTEIDYMNGKIVEYGRKHYIRTPLNLTLTNLVKAITTKNEIK